MTKSELIAELASANPHLRAADVETDRRHHLRRDHRGAGARRAGGAARLRRLHRQAPRCAHRPQSAHRRGSAGGREGGAVLQGGQGAARAGQPWPQRVSGRRWGGAAKLILAASARRCASGPLSHQLFPNARVLVRPQDRHCWQETETPRRLWALCGRGSRFWSPPAAFLFDVARISFECLSGLITEQWTKRLLPSSAILAPRHLLVEAIAKATIIMLRR